jgi:hypothetical protein
VILALHNDSAADFAELDRKIASTIKNLWRGKPLPFPILIDDDGKTYESYGISAIPSTVLINPEGKLVRPDLEELEAVLTPIPMARQIARGLDHQVEMGTSPTGVDLKFLLDTLSGMSRILIEPDPTAGIDLKAEVPLTMAGRLSLRSWLELALEPMGLVAVSGETGLIVKKASPGYRRDSTPSDTQREAASRITTKLESKTRFAFDKKTLAEVAQHFETEIEENFVIDPSDRLAGRLDFKTEVSGKAEDLPLKDALKSLLEPMGIEAVIVDEVVILRRRRP